MESHNFRAVVKHRVKVDECQGNICPKYTTIKLGFGTSDAPEPTLVEIRGQITKIVTTNKNVDAVYGMVMRAG